MHEAVRTFSAHLENCKQEGKSILATIIDHNNSCIPTTGQQNAIFQVHSLLNDPSIPN